MKKSTFKKNKKAFNPVLLCMLSLTIAASPSFAQADSQSSQSQKQEKEAQELRKENKRKKIFKTLKYVALPQKLAFDLAVEVGKNHRTIAQNALQRATENLVDGVKKGKDLISHGLETVTYRKDKKAQQKSDDDFKTLEIKKEELFKAAQVQEKPEEKAPEKKEEESSAKHKGLMTQLKNVFSRAQATLKANKEANKEANKDENQSMTEIDSSSSSQSDLEEKLNSAIACLEQKDLTLEELRQQIESLTATIADATGDSSEKEGEAEGEKEEESTSIIADNAILKLNNRIDQLESEKQDLLASAISNKDEDEDDEDNKDEEENEYKKRLEELEEKIAEAKDEKEEELNSKEEAIEIGRLYAQKLLAQRQLSQANTNGAFAGQLTGLQAPQVQSQYQNQAFAMNPFGTNTFSTMMQMQMMQMQMQMMNRFQAMMIPTNNMGLANQGLMANQFGLPAQSNFMLGGNNNYASQFSIQNPVQGGFSFSNNTATSNFAI